jgi:hypothetical protein
MKGQVLYKIDSTTKLLQYFAGTTATTQSTKTYAATGIESGLTVGDRLIVAGFSNTASNGAKTVATIATNSITVNEAIGASESGVSATFSGEYCGNFQNVQEYAKLIATAITSGNANLYIDFSNDGTNTDYTATTSITGGTGAITTTETTAKYAALRIRTNAADQTVLRSYLYGRTVS